MSNIKYKIIKQIGKGSYGTVYLCEDKNNKNQQYVIKRINLSKLSEKEREETINETKILQKLDHQNIIKFIEFFISKKEEIIYLNIITEYADDGDLSEKINSQIKKNYFSENIILDYFTQICLALKHIHDKKIIHRDLKSQNIFLTKKGLIKLGDFGIAKHLNNTWKKASTMIGTPYYLSPEIVLNKPYNFKSDIWSLGVLLYEMMCLKMPFDANSLPMLTLKIMKGFFSPPPKIYSNDLINLLYLLLNVNPDLRPNVNDILKMNIIRERSIKVLNLFGFNKDLSISFVKEFKKKEKNNNQYCFNKFKKINYNYVSYVYSCNNRVKDKKNFENINQNNNNYNVNNINCNVNGNKKNNNIGKKDDKKNYISNNINMKKTDLSKLIIKEEKKECINKKNDVKAEDKKENKYKKIIKYEPKSEEKKIEKNKSKIQQIQYIHKSYIIENSKNISPIKKEKSIAVIININKNRELKIPKSDQNSKRPKSRQNLKLRKKSADINKSYNNYKIIKNSNSSEVNSHFHNKKNYNNNINKINPNNNNILNNNNNLSNNNNNYKYNNNKNVINKKLNLNNNLTKISNNNNNKISKNPNNNKNNLNDKCNIKNNLNINNSSILNEKNIKINSTKNKNNKKININNSTINNNNNIIKYEYNSIENESEKTERKNDILKKEKSFNINEEKIKKEKNIKKGNLNKINREEHLIKLREVMKKGREKLRKNLIDNSKNNESEIIWPSKKEKNNNSKNKKKYFPDIIFVEKKLIDNSEENINEKKDEEDKYNKNRYLIDLEKNLNTIFNEEKEKNINEENTINNTTFETNYNYEFENDKLEIPKNIIIENKKKKKNKLNFESDFGKIEELKIKLEKDLGAELFIDIYHIIDESTDLYEVKFDEDKVKNKIKNEWNQKYNDIQINNAIKKIPEVFSIISQERISTFCS